MDVRELETESERWSAVPILRQLWTERPAEDVLAWTGEDDYHLFGGYVDEELVGVAGVVLTTLLHHRTQAWLYDLVVDEPHRGNGYGIEVIDFVESWAAERDCEGVALASPESKEGVHDYYRDRGYERWGYVIETGLSPSDS